MRIDLDGKTAFVSGSTQGIGRSIAARLAECGAVVHVNGRSRERVDAAVAELRSEQPGARFEAAAVDVVTDADALFAALPEVDILVNNLGIFGPMPLLEVDDDEWQRYWDVNVMSGIRLTRHYVRGMVARGWGRVQFMASDSAVVIPEEMVHYGVTKTALLGVSRGFAKVVAGSGVTVNAVIAGPTHTEGVEDFVRELVARPPVGGGLGEVRARTPAHIADRPADRARRDREPVRLPGVGSGVGDDRRGDARGRRVRGQHRAVERISRGLSKRPTVLRRVDEAA